MTSIKSRLIFLVPMGVFLAVFFAVMTLSGAGSAHGNESAQEESVLSEEQTAADLETAPEEAPLTLETLPANPFSDIPEDDACCDVLRYAVHYGYINGVAADTFAPFETANRAAVITVLFRMSGEAAPDYDGRFTDVAHGAWYADAVAWGVGVGIVSGVTEDTFVPNRPITRSELAAMLFRFAEYLGCDAAAAGDLSAYDDSEKVADYAHEPMSWALENDFYRTAVHDVILPDMPVSRLQLASALVALCAVCGDELAGQIIAALPQKAEAVSSLDHAAVQSVVDAAAEKYGAAGVQVAVVENGAVTDTFAYGWATRDSDPMTANHKMRVASISKVVVGMAAMLLHEDGVIDLDESIGTYWGVDAVNPYYKGVPVSVRTILTHTSSIVMAGDDVSRSYSSVRSKLANGYYSRLKPGSSASWGYNNYAFGVLGMTLELASGEFLTDTLRSHLFNAMDIDAAFYAGEVENTDLLATLYSGRSVSRSVATQKGMKNPTNPGDSGSPFAGGLAISAADLAKLVVLLIGDGRYEGVQMLDEASVAQMETLAFPVSDGFSQAFPLRWRSNVYGRDEIYYHTGSAYGVYNCMSYDPATGDGVVVLTTGAVGSRDENGIYRICSEIASQIYADLKEN